MGWAAAKVNFVPGLFLQAAAVALVVLYYHHADVRQWLGQVGELKKEWGFLYTMISSAIFCGIIPWLFRMAFPSLRPARPLSELVFAALYWGAICCTADAFYQFQAYFWGDSPAWYIVTIKTACDMLIFTPIIAAPCNSISHLWKENGFSFDKTRNALRGNWYHNVVMPNLVPNWMLWTPGIAITYSLPQALQLPMANLIGCFWALLCMTIANKSSNPKHGSSKNT